MGLEDEAQSYVPYEPADRILRKVGDASERPSFAADANVYDHDDVQESEKTIDEQLADLQSMMDKCKDRDGRPMKEDNHQSVGEEPLEQLKEQYEALCDEVLSMTNVKQEMESDLRQNVEKLQERIETQCREKMMLTERLLEAKERIGAKRQEMVDTEQELYFKVVAERASRQRLQAELSDHVQALQAQLIDLNHQIQDDWQSQVVLLKEIETESQLQTQYQSQLHAQREKTWQQNRDVIQNVVKTGQVPASVAFMFASSDGAVSKDAAFCSPNDPEWRIREQTEKQNEDMKKDLEAQISASKEQEAAAFETHTTIQLEALAVENAIAQLKETFSRLQRNRSALTAWTDDIRLKGPTVELPCREGADGTAIPAPSIGRTRDVQQDTEEANEGEASGIQSGKYSQYHTDFGVSVAAHEKAEAEIEEEHMESEGEEGHGSHDGAAEDDATDAEMLLAWSVAANLQHCMLDIDERQRELDRLSRDVELEAKRSEKAQAQLDKQKYLDAVEKYKLCNEVQEKKTALDALMAENNELQATIRVQNKWCFRCRAPPPPRSKAPSPKQAPLVGLAPHPAPSDASASSRRPEESTRLTSSSDGSKPQKEKWTQEHVFFVCRVGAETWSAESDVPVQVYDADGRPASSIAEAVELLRNSLHVADCYLVKDTSYSSWYCIWRRGRKGFARDRMERYIDNASSSRGSHSSGKRERSGRPSQTFDDV